MIYKIEIVQSVSNMNSDYSDVMLFFDSSFCSSFTNNRFITTNVLTDRNKKWFAIFPHYNEVNYFFNAFPSYEHREASGNTHLVIKSMTKIQFIEIYDFCSDDKV